MNNLPLRVPEVNFDPIQQVIVKSLFLAKMSESLSIATEPPQRQAGAESSLCFLGRQRELYPLMSWAGISRGPQIVL